MRAARHLAAPTFLLLAVLAVVTTRCTALTHAGQYGVGLQSLECYFCPSHPELRHAPCPSGNAPGGPDTTHVYAMQSIDLGADPGSWKAGYHAGLDLDCSSRPKGVPDSCIPVAAPPNAPYVSLPEGIDNTFSTQYLAPASKEGFDLQGALNAGLAGGEWGVLLKIDDWNEEPDDDEVVATLVFTAQSAEAGVPPRFDSTDRWSVCGGLDGGAAAGTSFTGGVAYVVGGTFVWDFQAAQHIYLWNAGGLLDVTLLRGVLMGRMSTAGLTEASLSGIWPSTATNIAPEFLAGCDQSRATSFECQVPGTSTLYLVRDVHLPSDAPEEKRCSGSSVGFALTFASTGDNLEAIPVPPTGCFSSCSYGRPDCGVDGSAD